MAKVLYLVHRMPYPPNKGDKVRSYHLLKHLCESHEVHLGTFVDDPADMAHLPTLQRLCASVCAVPLSPRLARVASLRGLLMGQPLTLPYYRSEALASWVRKTLEDGSVDKVVVFSSSMAQYTEAVDPQQVLVDFVDVDSAKWTDYAAKHAWPLSWLYRREGRKLLAYERFVGARSRHSFFATDKEAALFLDAAPECRGKVSAMNNGVDAAYFSPDEERPSPFRQGEMAVVFTGAMDYWPNVDAVTWFAREALPALKSRHPGVRFHVVGRSPTAAVQALASDDVNVTGTVPDVRPYLQHAAVVVAPLRLARGIQNKVLEAMAMGRPVVAATTCVEALMAQPGRDLIAAEAATDYVAAIAGLLSDQSLAQRIGRAGRECVVACYDWPAHMAVLDAHLRGAAQPRPGATRPEGSGSGALQ